MDLTLETALAAAEAAIERINAPNEKFQPLELSEDPQEASE